MRWKHLLIKMKASPNTAHRILVGELEKKCHEKFESGMSKYGNSWHDIDSNYLLRRMEEEFYEFRQSVEHDECLEDSICELADIVNFGIMFMIRSYQEKHDGSEKA